MDWSLLQWGGLWDGSTGPSSTQSVRTLSLGHKHHLHCLIWAKLGAHVPVTQMGESDSSWLKPWSAQCTGWLGRSSLAAAFRFGYTCIMCTLYIHLKSRTPALLKPTPAFKIYFYWNNTMAEYRPVFKSEFVFAALCTGSLV